MLARLPFLRPNPPRLSELTSELAEIETRRQFTNFGPVNAALESRFDEHFATRDACLTVCNATIGLMLAIRVAASRRPGATLALMPSFTFAATGEAAMWAGLTPVFCDVDPETWLPCARDEERLIAEHGDRIAVIVPYATFGNGLDLARYQALRQRTGIPVVVDAAASLGAVDATGNAFGSGAPFPVVFSMHATKTFAAGEGGLIHCADTALIAQLRSMANYGFEGKRSATTLGLNAKLSEVMALIGLARFRDFDALSAHRDMLGSAYRRRLQDWRCQGVFGRRQAYCFMAVVLPDDVMLSRDDVVRALASEGIECGSYFSPHLAQQPLFKPFADASRLPTTDMLSSRIIALPLWDEMGETEVEFCCDALLRLRQRHSLLPHLGALLSLPPETAALA